MTVQHKDLTGADLHEPKGVSGASSGTVYTANGAGSGSWIDPLADLNYMNTFALSGAIPDVSTANSSYSWQIPVDCTLTKLYFTLEGAITVADAIVSLYRAGVLLAQTKTIAYSGSGAGVTFTLTLSPTYTFTEGQVLRIQSDGASTDAQRLFTTLKFTV